MLLRRSKTATLHISQFLPSPTQPRLHLRRAARRVLLRHRRGRPPGHRPHFHSAAGSRPWPPL